MAATAGQALTQEQRQRLCGNKRKFTREGEAINFVIRMRNRGAFGRAPGFVRKCEVCGSYHVDKRPERLAA